MSAASLADLVGVTRAAISQYDHGKQTPSPQVLRTIADRLNFPIPFFLAVAPDQPPSTVFYRSFTSATKGARLRAQRRYEWLREIVAVLRRFVKFPAYALPSLDLPREWKDLSSDDIESAAKSVRNALGVPDQPLPNVVVLLERAGVLTMRHGLDSRALDAFSSWPESEPNPFVVLGSDKASAVRSRFDAAHEVGHMVLHRTVSERHLRDSDALKVIEGQANRFACALLLPRDEFARVIGSPSLDRLLVLKTTWGTSVAAMIHRCSDLGLINDHQSRKLWMNHARRGWKKREPYDDVIPAEEPRFIRRSIELVLEKGIVSREQLLHYVTLYPRDIEDVTGLPDGYLTARSLSNEGDIETLPFVQNVIPFKS